MSVLGAGTLVAAYGAWRLALLIRISGIVVATLLTIVVLAPSSARADSLSPGPFYGILTPPAAVSLVATTILTVDLAEGGGASTGVGVFGISTLR